MLLIHRIHRLKFNPTFQKKKKSVTLTWLHELLFSAVGYRGIIRLFVVSISALNHLDIKHKIRLKPDSKKAGITSNKISELVLIQR